MTEQATKNKVEIDWRYHRRQTEALQTLDEMRDIPELAELLYGGAKGGGKSVVGVRWAYKMCRWIIDEYGLEPREKPIPVGYLGRMQWSDFSKTTLETWFEQIPPELYEYKEQKKEIWIDHTVKLVLGGFDKREDIKKFNSAEYGFAFVDQVEEIPQTHIGTLKATMRRKINNRDLPYVILYTANPAQCWLKKEFVHAKTTKRKKFIQALPSDNIYLTKSYLDTLQKSFGHRKELLDAYLHGSWDALEGSDIIIKDLWIRQAQARKFFVAKNKKKRLVVADIARYGDDETVIHYMENTKRVDEEIYGQKDLYYTADRIEFMCHQHKSKDGQLPAICVDEDGVGGGVVDILRRKGYTVIGIDSAAKADDPEKFYNVRAEMWWTAGKMYSDGDVEKDDMAPDDELDRQLTTPTYKFCNGRIIVEPKEEVKKRVGGADRADARVMGLYVQPRVPVDNTGKKDGWSDDDNEAEGHWEAA